MRLRQLRVDEVVRRCRLMQEYMAAEEEDELQFMVSQLGNQRHVAHTLLLCSAFRARLHRMAALSIDLRCRA